MQIETKRFGVQEVDPEAVLTFPEGLPGFEQIRQYKLFHEEGEHPVVYWLQAVEDPEVSFSVASPARLGFSYELTLSDEEQERLQIEDVEDVVLLLMLLKPIDPDSDDPLPLAEVPVIANVTAPLIVNTKARRGVQKVLKDIDYSINIHSRS